MALIQRMIWALVFLFLGLPIARADEPLMTLSSPDFKEGERLADSSVFKGFGCVGENKVPRLTWSGVPEGTKYLALTVYDPDAPTGSGWWHWLVINIPPSATAIGGDAPLPEGAIETRTDYGVAGYGGPCPPVGDKPHHYVFTLYALKDKIPLGPDVPAAQVGFYANSLKIKTVTLTGLYGR